MTKDTSKSFELLLDDLKYQENDVVKATMSEGKSLIKGKSYKIVKVCNEYPDPFYWIQAMNIKSPHKIVTIAFDNQLEQ